VEFTIHGRRAAASAGVREHARAKLERLDRYFNRAWSVRVRLEKPDPRPSVSVVVPVARGTTIVAEADGADYLEAIDRAVGRIERQLKRHKAKLRDVRPRQAARRTGR